MRASVLVVGLALGALFPLAAAGPLSSETAMLLSGSLEGPGCNSKLTIPFYASGDHEEAVVSFTGCGLAMTRPIVFTGDAASGWQSTTPLRITIGPYGIGFGIPILIEDGERPGSGFLMDALFAAP